jgi:D-alanyl-D-alanine carboxypeptidase
VFVLLAAIAVLAVIWGQLGKSHSLAAHSGSPGGRQTILLVNADHPLPHDFAKPRLVGLAGTIPVSSRSVRVARAVKQPLVKLFTAARRAGWTHLYVASGYRTSAEQRRLWDEAADHSYVQRPGHSEHQTGQAVDLADLNAGAKGLDRNGAGQWLADNSWKYGFVLRYPPQKKEITGISYEPWHFRYVGRDVAETCHDNDWVLEEYVAGP